MLRSSARPPGLPRVVDGKFRLIAPLAAGPHTVSFIAEHTGIGRRVELKTLGQDVPFDGPEADRLFREARAMGTVAHPGIQGVVDSGTDDDGRPYVVYEALRGVSIAELMAEHPNGLYPVRVGRIALSTLEALRAMHHAGIVVRGLGPGNVIVLPARDDEEPIKLRGLEQATFVCERAPEDEIPVTPWLAPEIRRGAPGIDPRVDVYSMGMMLRHLITGQAQPGGQLPDTARRGIERATADDPNERFPDIDVLMQAVALLTPTSSRPPREEMNTPEDALAADLHYLWLRRSTRHGRRTKSGSHASLHALPVLLAVDAIHRRLPPSGWAELAASIDGLEELREASSNLDAHAGESVPVELFSRILGIADSIAGRGDLGFLTELAESIAARGLLRLFPHLPSPAPPETFVDRFAYLWSRIAMQGRASIVERSLHAAKLVVSEQVEPSLELSGFMAALLRAAIRSTGHAGEVSLTTCQALGDPVDTYQVSWSPIAMMMGQER